MENVIELTGPKSGPTSIILAGVHGNEVCGVKAFEQLLPTLTIESGRVLFAYGNPRAIQQNVRFIEMNLNRAFKLEALFSETERETYEYQRAQFLKTYLDQADALLDVHASFTPGSQRFIICEKESMNIAKHLPFDLVASGFDNLEPGGTDGYMNSLSKIGVCIECGYLEDESSTEIAKKSILAFLSVRGYIDSPLKIYTQSQINFDYIYFTKTDNFKLAKQFNDFEKIPAGQLIGFDGEEEIRAKKDGIIIFARNRDKINDEAFLFGEYKKDLL